MSRIFQHLKRLSAALLLACLAQAPAAHAALLSLQPFDTLAENGDTVSLDLMVSGLGNFGPDSLGAFDIFVGYDTAALSFAGYTLGNLLGRVDLFEAIDASGGAGGGAVNIAEVSLLSATSLNTLQPGQFVLASLRFDVLDLNAGASTALSILQGALLADAAGSRLAISGTTQATISSRAAVPLPGTLLLLLSALASWPLTRMAKLPRALIALSLLCIGSFAHAQCGAPVPLLCDANGDNYVDSADITAITLARGTPASGPGDIRDIDIDGQITMLDARQCVAQCAKPQCGAEYPGYTVVKLAPGDDLETRTQAALIDAEPNTVIELPAGTFHFKGNLSISVDNIVLRGKGNSANGGTVLNFAGQTSGAQGILATGNNFVVEDLAVEDTPGDGIKMEGNDGVTMRRVRVEWTGGPDEDNGPYGLYPVQTRNVLIEDSIVRGASDAGVYVGQSEIIIVRRNYVYENVAGIEIENSKFADVYDNNTTGNTGGILVFDLPGPPVQGGEATRVFNNRIVDNNEPNFAPPGNIVGSVPAGTGLMIMANDDIEVFGNTITGNRSFATLIVSYYFVNINVRKPSYDPVPEKIYIHDNTMSNNGYNPDGDAALIGLVLGGPQANFYDSSGVGTNAGLLVEFPNGLTADQAICVVDNGPESSIGQFNISVILNGIPGNLDASTDPTRFHCTHASLPPIELEPPVDPADPTEPNPLELCDVAGTGRNADAYLADCPNLSDYRLFADASNPLANANGGVIYDLNTPLFTDYANKYRFVFVPEGARAAYRATDVFDFPVGTIIAKTFTIQADLRLDDSAQDIIETRLLIRRRDGWTALPYIWNSDKSDAVLTKTGGTQPVSWIDKDGLPRFTDYVIPNTNNCANCHGEDKLIPIGPTARSLNKAFAYDSGVANQLDHWTAVNILSGAPDDTAAIPSIPLWEDTSANLNDRARGYLDVNCAHCHSPGGAGDTSGLFLDYFRPFGPSVGACKPPVAAGGGSGGLLYDIVPGNSTESIMVYRMASNELEVRMPEIGRSIVHPEGVQLIADWIDAMAPVNCDAP
jgi:parallel beta-helix repeat protein